MLDMNLLRIYRKWFYSPLKYDICQIEVGSTAQDRRDATLLCLKNTQGNFELKWKEAEKPAFCYLSRIYIPKQRAS